jgi:hypothetical protein
MELFIISLCIVIICTFLHVLLFYNNNANSYPATITNFSANNAPISISAFAINFVILSIFIAYIVSYKTLGNSVVSKYFNNWIVYALLFALLLSYVVLNFLTINKEKDTSYIIANIISILSVVLDFIYLYFLMIITI